MIYLRISTHSRTKARHIAKILLEENLAIDLNMTEATKRLQLVNGQLSSATKYLITGKTKALLFPLINEQLKESLGKENMPELYALPIVYMDWEQSQSLVSAVKTV